MYSASLEYTFTPYFQSGVQTCKSSLGSHLRCIILRLYPQKNNFACWKLILFFIRKANTFESIWYFKHSTIPSKYTSTLYIHVYNMENYATVFSTRYTLLVLPVIIVFYVMTKSHISCTYLHVTVALICLWEQF